MDPGMQLEIECRLHSSAPRRRCPLDALIVADHGDGIGFGNRYEAVPSVLVGDRSRFAVKAGPLNGTDDWQRPGFETGLPFSSTTCPSRYVFC